MTKQTFSFISSIGDSLKRGKQGFSDLVASIPQEFQTMREKFMDLGKTNANLADMHFREGDFYDAAMRYNMASKFRKKDPMLAYNAARCYFVRNQLEKAKASFTKAESMQPNLAESDYFLQRINHPDKAITTPSSLIAEQYDLHAEVYNQRYLAYNYIAHDEAKNALVAALKPSSPESSPSSETDTTNTTDKQEEITIIETHADDNLGTYDILDLGCGTGLAGYTFKMAKLPKTMRGIDISSKMIEASRTLKAANTNLPIYDSLAQSDIIAYLNQTGEQYDIISAVSVCDFISDIESLFEAVSKRLKPGGYFVFSLEHSHSKELKKHPILPIMPGVQTYNHVETYAALIEKHLTKISVKDLELYDGCSGMIAVYTTLNSGS